MYFITTLDEHDGDTRCVGYVSSLEDARDIVENNRYDLWEGCYTYIVVENIKEGVYEYDFSPLWFTYNMQTGKYEESEKPDCVEYNVGFAIG